MWVQVDRELRNLKREVQTHMLAEQAMEQGPDESLHGPAQEELRLLQQLLDTADRCLDNSVDVFREGIQVCSVWACQLHAMGRPT